MHPSQPLAGAEPAGGQTKPLPVVSVKKASGEVLAFKVDQGARAECVNGALNVSVTSTDGMMLQINGLPMPAEDSAPVMNPGHARIVLMNTPLIGEALVAEGAPAITKLTLTPPKAPHSAACWRVLDGSGTARAGGHVLHVTFSIAIENRPPSRSIAPEGATVPGRERQ